MELIEKGGRNGGNREKKSVWEWNKSKNEVLKKEKGEIVGWEEEKNLLKQK